MMLMLAFTAAATAQVSLTPASGGTLISADKASNASSPVYTTLGDIVITENSVGDIDPSTTSIVLNAPSGWLFQTSGVTANVTASGTPDVSKTVTASDITDGTKTANVSTVTVNASAATHLGFLVQPVNTAATATITPSVKVQVLDAYGNVVTSDNTNITIAIGNNPSAGTLSGTLTVAASSGVATFNGLSINNLGTGYTLSVTDGALTGATSTAFNIVVGAASKLVISTQPVNTVAGATMASVVVQITDIAGNVVTGNTSNVTMAILTNPGGGTLGGTVTVAAVNGVATFSNLNINKTGVGYTLRATDGGLSSATSSAFNITPGAASQLAFSTQPANTAAGATMASVVVQVQDANGNVVTTDNSNVTLSIGANPGGGALSGTLTVAAVNGVATFSTLSINKTGIGYTLIATGSFTKTSNTFNITPGAASQLVFSTQPVSTTGGATMSAVVVQVQDANGNVVTTDTRNIVMSIGTNPGGGTLSGTLTVAAVNGVATFSNLSIDKAGTGYTLTATGTLTKTSSAFDITVGALSKFVFSNISTQTAGTPFTVTTITAADAGGNAITSFTGTVTLSSSATTGTITPTTSTSFVSGVLTGQSITLTQATSQTITATSGAVTGTSNAFTVNAGAAVKLQILLPGETAAPGSATGKTGTPTGQNVGATVIATVNAVDANWNIVNTVTHTIAISSTDGAAGLPANAALVAGTNTFNVTLNTPGAQTITATDQNGSPLTAATSSVVNVNPVSGAAVIVNYLFSNNSTLPFYTAPNISSTLTASSTLAMTTGGTAAGGNAIVANPVGTGNNALTQLHDNSWTFLLNGSALPSYSSFKVYFQVNRTDGGGQNITLQYKLTPGGTYTTVGVNPVNPPNTPNGVTIGSGTWVEALFTLPSTANNPSALYLNVASATGTSSSTLLDNFQVQATTTVLAPPALTAAVGATLDNPFTITFTDISAWRAAITKVQFGTTTLVSGTDYTISAGQIVLTPGGLIKTAGTQTITVVATGYTNAIVSQAIATGAFNKLLLLLPGETAVPGSTLGKTGTPTSEAAGVAFNATVQAVDKYWNPVTSTNTVGITSSDLIAVLPANKALAGGVQTFSVTLKTAGSKTVTATDITDGTKILNSSTVTVIGGAAANIAINTGNNQSAGAGTTVPIAPSVLVTDAYGNPVSGVTVTFAILSGGGTLTGTTQITNASGIDTVGSWTLGAVAGTNQMTATSAGLSGSPLTFTATGASVSTGTITGAPFCVTGSTGASVSVPFTSIGTFASGNTYTVQLSNASGSFASPVNISTPLSSTANSGTISATIPAGTVSGTGYRIRVVASNPSVNGTDNGVNLTVSLPTLTSFSPSCTSAPGVSVTINGSGFLGATGVSFNGTAATSFTVVSDVQITATVPAGATTGLIRVTTTCNPSLASATNFTVNAAPNSPTGLISLTSTTTTISGSITAPSPTPTGYLIFFSTSTTVPVPVNGTTYTQGNTYTLGGISYIAGYVGTSSTFTSSTLVSNTNYHLYIFAYNNAGSCSGAYSTTPLLTSIYTCVAAPTGLTSSAITGNSATVSWTAPAGSVTSYTLNVNPGSAGAPWANTYTITSGTSFNLTGLSNSVTYYYQVIANNSANLSSTCGTAGVASSTANFTTTYISLNTDYFKSVTSGNWSSLSTWNSSHDGVTWHASSLIPDQNATEVIITTTGTSSLTVTVDVPSTASNLQINDAENGGNLNLTLQVNQNLHCTGSVRINPPNLNSFTDQISVSGTSTLTIDGSLDVEGINIGVGSYRVGQLTLAAGAVVNVGGDITSSGTSLGARIVFAATGNGGTINLQGNWLYPNTALGVAILTAGVGTVNFNGTAAQQIGANAISGFYNLTNSNTTAALSVLPNNTTVTHTLNMNGASTLLIPAANAVFNNAAAAGTISGNGTLQVTRVASTADYYNQYKFLTNTLSAMTVDYIGAGNQTVNDNTTRTILPYGNLILEGSGTKSLQGSLGTSTTNGVNGYVKIKSTATLSAGTFGLTLGGNWADSGTTNVTAGNLVQTTGTVYFNGAAAQQIYGTVTGESFGGLSTVAAGTALSVGGSITTLNLSSNLTMGNSTSFAAGTATNIFASGNWTDNNTGSATGGFTPNAAGTVTFKGGIAQAINGTALGQTFYHLSTATSSTALSAAGSMASLFVNGNLTIAGSTSLSAGTATNIKVGGNWSNNGSFTAVSSTVTFNGAAAQVIGGATSTTFNGLTINNTSGGTTLIDPAHASVAKTVTGALTLTSGLLSTDAADLLILTNTASAVAAVPDPVANPNYYTTTSYVDGPMQRTGSTNFTFPIGKSSNGYEPISISAASNSSEQTYTAEYIRANSQSRGLIAYGSPLVRTSTCDYWTLNLASGSSLPLGVTANLTMYWNPNNPCNGKLYVTDIPTLAIAHNDGTAWDAVGIGAYVTNGSVTNGSIGFAGVNAFSPFTLGSTSIITNPLPLNLIDFDAELNPDKTVGLKWTTQQEVDMSHYMVERSADGLSWKDIGRVEAKGNSPVPSTYGFTDQSPLGGANYYRIRMYNLDNASGITRVKVVRLLQVKGINIFPIPARDYLNVSVSGATVDLNIKLINQLGQVLQVTQVKAGASTIVTLDTHTLAQGTYLLQVSGADGIQQTSKVLIMR